MAQVSKDSTLDVSPEFIESGKLFKTKPKKRGGPYTKDEKVKRQNEVHRLRFGFGYSARKISELMKIPRNTINRDINYLLSQARSNVKNVHPEFLIAESVEKLDVQKTRLCEMMYNSSINSEKISIEKMIFQIESKIIQIKLKLPESKGYIIDVIMDTANKILKKNFIDGQLVSTKDFEVCSEKAKDKIYKILKEDKRF